MGLPVLTRAVLSLQGSKDNNLIELALGGGDGGMTTGIYLDEATQDRE